MAFTYDQMMSYDIPEVEQEITERDCIIYALSVGIGEDPMDERQLAYTYESNLHMMPTQVNVLAAPGFWLKNEDVGCDWKKVLHGEQRFTIHRPLPTSGTIVGKSKVVAINDKGPEKGAFLYSQREVLDKASGELLCTMEQTTVARGDGGCGGSDPAPYAPYKLPDREPDLSCEFSVPDNAALLYRLNGDYNPLHADPDVAATAGFKQPILHGLCTFGYAGHAVLREACNYEPNKIKSMSVRFTSPVYPGEPLRTDMWRVDEGLAYRTMASARDVQVLGNGLVTLND